MAVAIGIREGGPRPAARAALLGIACLLCGPAAAGRASAGEWIVRFAPGSAEAAEVAQALARGDARPEHLVQVARTLAALEPAPLRARQLLGGGFLVVAPADPVLAAHLDPRILEALRAHPSVSSAEPNRLLQPLPGPPAPAPPAPKVRPAQPAAP